MIPKVNLRVGEISFMFFLFISFSKIALRIGYKFDKFALFDFCLTRRHIRFSEFLSNTSLIVVMTCDVLLSYSFHNDNNE